MIPIVGGKEQFTERLSHLIVLISKRGVAIDAERNYGRILDQGSSRFSAIAAPELPLIGRKQHYITHVRQGAGRGAFGRADILHAPGAGSRAIADPRLDIAARIGAGKEQPATRIATPVNELSLTLTPSIWNVPPGVPSLRHSAGAQLVLESGPRKNSRPLAPIRWIGKDTARLRL